MHPRPCRCISPDYERMFQHFVRLKHSAGRDMCAAVLRSSTHPPTIAATYHLPPATTTYPTTCHHPLPPATTTTITTTTTSPAAPHCMRTHQVRGGPALERL